MPPPKPSTTAAAAADVVACEPPARPNPRTPAPPPKPGDALALDLDLLDDNPFQPRTEMDPAKLSELAASIRQSGLLQPIAVRSAGPGRYQVVAGHRRVAAYRKLQAEAGTEAEKRQYQLIRAHVVAAVSDQAMAVAAYVENAQRDNLNALDEAAALDRIRHLGHYPSATEVAQATGQPERRVRRLLKLCTAPKAVKEAVSTGLLVEVGEAAEPGAPPRRERRRLDLLAALEFTRLFEHHAKKKPQAAEERTAAAMKRALSEGWGVRRIQTYVEGILAGRAPTDSGDIGAPTTPAAPSALCVVAPERLVLHLSRLPAATTEELKGAQHELQNALGVVEEQLRTREADPAAA